MHTHTHAQAAATEGAGDGGKGVVFTSTVEFSSLLQARWVESIDCVCVWGGASGAYRTAHIHTLHHPHHFTHDSIDRLEGGQTLIPTRPPPPIPTPLPT